jgi:hypothetical protein
MSPQHSTQQFQSLSVPNLGEVFYVGKHGRVSELKLLVVTASTTLKRSTPGHCFRTHNSVVVGSSPTRPTTHNCIEILHEELLSHVYMLCCLWAMDYFRLEQYMLVDLRIGRFAPYSLISLGGTIT